MPRIVCLCDRYWGNVLPAVGAAHAESSLPIA
jgi:hypothetical protein